MQRIVHVGLGLRSRVGISKPLFTPIVCKKRAERALKLHIRFKGRAATISDEKNITYNLAVNRQNFL